MTPDAPVNAPPPPVMVQCEITGQWVPEDEIITLQGHRVCADGKLELLERLRSGVGMAGHSEIPSVLRRLGAIVFDEVLLYGIYMVLVVVAVFSVALSGPNPERFPVVTNAVGFISAVLDFAYFLVLHGHFGRTLGKVILGIKVTRSDESPLTWKGAFYRTAVYKGPSLAGRCLVFVLACFAISGLAIFAVIAGVVGTLVTGGMLVYMVISGIMAACDNDRQRAIHDRAAGTRVVMVI